METVSSEGEVGRVALVDAGETVKFVDSCVSEEITGASGAAGAEGLGIGGVSAFGGAAGCWAWRVAPASTNKHAADRVESLSVRNIDFTGIMVWQVGPGVR